MCRVPVRVSLLSATKIRLLGDAFARWAWIESNIDLHRDAHPGGRTLAAHDNEHLVTVLAREVIMTVGPGDLRFFDADAEAYFDDPERALSRADADTALSSGMEAFAAALIPVVLYAAQKVIDCIAENTVKGTGKVISRRWSGRRHAREVPSLSEISPLDAAQQEQIRKLVVSCAEEHGVAPTVADDLSRAFVGHLPRRADAQES
jgi:hypothetical protein